MFVLLAEEESSIRKFYARALHAAGHLVSGYATASEALRSTSESTFDLLLLSSSLPDDESRSLVRTLRARGNSAPILMLTRDESDEQLVGLLETGADSYMPKDEAVPRLLVARCKALARLANRARQGR